MTIIITKELKEQMLAELLKGFIKENFLDEANLSQIRKILQWQRSVKTSPTRDGRGKRPSNGFYNHNKHVAELKEAGIQPEFEGMEFRRLNPAGYNWGPIGVERPIGDYPIAKFRTKSYSRSIGEKNAKLESYQQYIVFGDWPLIAQNPHLSLSEKVTQLLKGEQSYHCQCMSDPIHYGYAKHQRDDDRFLDPADQQLIPAPIRNPEGRGGLCKHLDLVFDSKFEQNVWGPKFLQEFAEFFAKRTKGKKKTPPQKQMGAPVPIEKDMGPPIQKPELPKDKNHPDFGKPGFRGQPIPKLGEPGQPVKGPIYKPKITVKKPTNNKNPEPLSPEWLQKQQDQLNLAQIPPKRR